MLLGEAKWPEKKTSAEWIYRVIQELKSKGIPPLERRPNTHLRYVVFVPEKPRKLNLSSDVRIVEAKEVIEVLQ